VLGIVKLQPGHVMSSASSTCFWLKAPATGKTGAGIQD
jgi:hypothetical protein